MLSILKCCESCKMVHWPIYGGALRVCPVGAEERLSCHISVLWSNSAVASQILLIMLSILPLYKVLQL